MQGDAMSNAKTFLVACTAVVSLMLCLPAAAQGPASTTIQEQTPAAPTPQKPAAADDGWHFDLTPYLWFPGISGTVGALGRNTGVHLDPGQLISHFHLGVLVNAEARKGRLILPLDFMWIKLQDNHSTPFIPGVSSAQVQVTESILTPEIGYRIVDQEKVKVDALIGLRYWHLGEHLDFLPSGLFNNLSPTQNWVDGVAGGKIAFLLSPKVSVTVAGDAGGGGADLDYQAVGVLGLKVSRICVLDLGYRYLYVNYHDNPPRSFLFDAHESGALLGVTFNLK
jgi:hypothetical protein